MKILLADERLLFREKLRNKQTAKVARAAGLLALVGASHG